jgi:2-dehydro-3-deoxyphosphogluconate aldolase/(4S)-4-hydroxy-2-oxoglutarate aldolase
MAVADLAQPRRIIRGMVSTVRNPPATTVRPPFDLAAELRDQRLVAIVRGRDRMAIVACCVALVESGLPLVEIPLVGEAARAALAEAIRQVGDDGCVGAGTVLSAEDADHAAVAGCRFVVTPALGPGAVRAASIGLPALVGAFTPTEIVQAHAGGAAAVKLFPVSVGGVEYLRALRQPFPDIPLVPVGGVGIEEARSYLAVGALAVGVGSPLVGDAADGGSLIALRERALRFREVVDESSS